MPGAGKTTIGPLLGRTFIDTDQLIDAQTFIKNHGLIAFQEAEREAIEQLSCENTVIATGGSVVYCKRKMAALRRLGDIVYLQVNFIDIEQRIIMGPTRTLVMKPGMTLRDLYDERTPLYTQYADHIVQTEGLTPSEIARYIHELY